MNAAYHIAVTLCLINAVLWPTLNSSALGIGAAILWVVVAKLCKPIYEYGRG